MREDCSRVTLPLGSCGPRFVGSAYREGSWPDILYDDRISGRERRRVTPGDFATLNDLFAEDLLWHEPGRDQLAGDYSGREAVYQMFGRLMEITEGSFHLDLQSVFADDERGVSLVVTTASRGGRSVRSYDAHIFHLRDGKVVEF